MQNVAWAYDEANNAWSMTHLSYCLAPTSERQYLNIYVPGDYLNGDGTLTDAVVNG